MLSYGGRVLRAQISAATTWGLFVRALRRVRSSRTSPNPAAPNSLRKAPASFAPAIQANQLLSVFCSGAKGADKISSAA